MLVRWYKETWYGLTGLHGRVSNPDGPRDCTDQYKVCTAPSIQLLLPEPCRRLLDITDIPAPAHDGHMLVTTWSLRVRGSASYHRTYSTHSMPR